MSTDYDIVCRRCKLGTHIGQRFAGGSCLGYGSNDREQPILVAKFITKHIGCGEPGNLVVVMTDPGIEGVTHLWDDDLRKHCADENPIWVIDGDGNEVRWEDFH